MGSTQHMLTRDPCRAGARPGGCLNNALVSWVLPYVVRLRTTSLQVNAPEKSPGHPLSWGHVPKTGSELALALSRAFCVNLRTAKKSAFI